MSGGGVGSYMAVPVWDFFGGDYTSLITVNAINGSIIDRGLGY